MIIASIHGTVRRVNITGGVTLLVLSSLAIFGPQEPHPFIPVMAIISIVFLVLGWLATVLFLHFRELN
ncbi:hypothetical protein [Alterisphingorhabdus coralli]|uniref:Uncharacterized protein n=1 Tax=Alterisphingorhabdus coralli TaxID=3071408 RepID=A0AA97FAW9_9SPHN|nr:hypothetical protein [Parasphingorhabdus sp. SCSIO 66989]WOE76257.1 hypothetical protein RB602_05965 [Parasphingorhabdus sp. SCSIO 66989]